jgi:CRP/FNR family transcriptional regulator
MTELAAQTGRRESSVDSPTGKVACGRCCLRELCVPAGFSPCELELMRSLVREKHMKVRRGEALFLAGEPYRGLYAVHTGAFKTTLVTRDGREKITGFSFAGDMLGLDAIAGAMHPATAIALEDSGVCSVPQDRLDDTTERLPQVRRQVSRMMSREIVRGQDLTLMLSAMAADERLAVFLLNVVSRFADRGFDVAAIRLPMSRPEIASYLGLTPETVSRLFSRLHQQGLVDVSARTIRILRLRDLQVLAGLDRSCGAPD